MRYLSIMFVFCGLFLLGACGEDSTVESVKVVVERTFTPSSDRAGHDFSGDGVITSLGSETSTGDFFGICVSEGFNPGDPAEYEEKRLAFEFDISSLPDGVTIESAVIELTQAVPGTFMGAKVFEFHVYPGNSAVELPDFMIDNLAVGPFTVSDVSLPIEGNITAKVSALFIGGASSVGVIIKHETVVSPAVGFCSMASVRTSNFSDSTKHPRLIIRFVEP